MQLPAVRLAKAKGWDVVVAAAAINRQIEALADRCEQVDLRDRDEVSRLARALKQEPGLDGIFTAGTDFSTTVAWAAEQAGLPGIPYSSALAATDKARMRAVFRAAGVPSPSFYTAEKADCSLPAGFGFPLVVKPVDNMGARGVRRADDERQLREALEAALEQSACGQAIVEQYLEGPELSLDAVIHHGGITVCGVADRHICFPPYFVEMGHTMPSALDPDKLRAAEQVFRRGIRALGITNGAAKGDIKITPGGAVIGEIAARLSGGYMSGWTYPLSSGVEVTEAALNIAVGLKPGRLKPTRSWVSAERAFISIPGTIRRLQGLEEAGEVSGVLEMFLRVEPGREVALPVNNMGKCGNIIAAAPSRAAALESVGEAVRAVLVRLAPENERTDAFLRGGLQSAFSAYSGLSPAFHASVERMPFRIGDWKRFSGRAEDLLLLEPAGAERETARDWHGWTLADAFRRVVQLTGARVQVSDEAGRMGTGRSQEALVLGSLFWNALLKGGLQAGLYVIDSLCEPSSDPKHVVRRLCG